MSCQVIGSGDTNPIKCVSTLTGVFQPKYQESVIKPFTLTLHTGLFIYVGTKTYTGSSSDNVILKLSLQRLEAIKLSLTAEEIFKRHPCTLPIEITREIQQVCLE